MDEYSDDEIRSLFSRVCSHACASLKKHLPMLFLPGLELTLDARVVLVTRFSVMECRWNNLEHSGKDGELSPKQIEKFVKRDVNRKFVDEIVRSHKDKLLYPKKVLHLPRRVYQEKPK